MFPARHHVMCAAALVLLLFGVAARAFGVVWIPVWPKIEAQALPPQVAPVEARARCPRCGWIESKRALPPAPGDLHAAQVYEYTVRMRDGSSSIFEEALPVSWREGERLMVIH